MNHKIITLGFLLVTMNLSSLKRKEQERGTTQNQNTTEPNQPDGETQATDQATDHSSEPPPDSDHDTVLELPESLEEARKNMLETLRKQRRRKSTIFLGYQENLPLPQIRDIAKHNLGLLPKVLWVMLLAIPGGAGLCGLYWAIGDAERRILWGSIGLRLIFEIFSGFGPQFLGIFDRFWRS